MKRKLFMLILLLSFSVPLLIPPAAAAPDGLSLVIVDKEKDAKMQEKVFEIVESLKRIRQFNNIAPGGLPICIYHYDNPESRAYVRAQLGIYEGDLLYLGIAKINNKGIPYQILYDSFRVKHPPASIKATLNKFESLTGMKIYVFTGFAIDSDPPYAEIFINGVTRGNAPMLRKEFNPGIYEIILKKEKYDDYRLMVNLQFAELIEIKAELAPSFGTLEIQSTPETAKIFVDNKQMGYSPQNLDLDPGTYAIRLEKLYYKPWESVVSIKKGEKVLINAVLEGE